MLSCGPRLQRRLSCGIARNVRLELRTRVCGGALAFLERLALASACAMLIHGRTTQRCCPRGFLSARVCVLQSSRDVAVEVFSANLRPRLHRFWRIYQIETYAEIPHAHAGEDETAKITIQASRVPASPTSYAYAGKLSIFSTSLDSAGYN